MDVYGDVYSKLALCLSSSQVAKSGLVGEFGVGEDLPFSFFGWVGGELVVVGSFSVELMRLPVSGRLGFVRRVGEVFRQVFGCDSVSFVAEGFVSLVPGVTSGLCLRGEFAGGNEGVFECLSVAHVCLGVGGVPEVVLVSVPYFYEGRSVVWGDELGFFSGVGRVLLDSPVLAVLVLCLGLDVLFLDDDGVDVVLGELVGLGVNLQEFGGV